MVSIKVNDDRVLKRLDRLQNVERNVIAPTLREFGDDQVKDFRNLSYPPERSGQRYQRTYDMRGSWHGVRRGNTQFAVVNDANHRGRYYPIFAVGDGEGKRQAWMHRGRWWKAFDRIVGRLPRFTDKLAERLDL